MIKKYDHYLTSVACKTLEKAGYKQAIKNIIEDDETYVTEEMKNEFFEYIQKHDGVSDLLQYCNDFFYNPKYHLRGLEVSSLVYKIQLGRVANKAGFRRGLNNVILNTSKTTGLSPISDLSDEALLDSLLFDTSNINSTVPSKFKDLLADTGIGSTKIQDYPMWTFESFDDTDVYAGYNPKDLPCILGLPGSDGTAKDYQKIKRITFSLRIPNTIKVRKPTSFDAGIMSVWVLGGKTKIHTECEANYGAYGFEEYIHEPITFHNITSELYSI